jgi:hypothetical protein
VETAGGIGESDYADAPPLWSATKAKAEANYAPPDPGGDENYYPWYAFSVGKKLGENNPPYYYKYQAQLHRARCRMTQPGLSTDFAHVVEFYLFGQALPGYDFDKNGDDFIQDKWTLYDTVGPTTDAAVQSAWFGSLDQPNWCSEPTGTPQVTTKKGWECANLYALIRWNVAGGFVYV